MTERNSGLTVDPLFVGATRPPMRWGVTYLALLGEMVITMEVFLLSKNLLTLLVALPLHGTAVLLCQRDARFFDIAALWLRTRVPALVGTLRYWRGTSYSPLALDLPDPRGRRRRTPHVRL